MSEKKISCKKCQSEEHRKNGKARGQQRYKCKRCGYSYINQDLRTNEQVAAKKAICILFYSLGKASINMLAKILGHSPSLIYRWICQGMKMVPEPQISPEIKEIEFDEMWHFVESKKKTMDLQSFRSRHQKTRCLGGRLS